MKRIIAVLLSISLFVGMGVFSFAAAAEKGGAPKLESAQNLPLDKRTASINLVSGRTDYTLTSDDGKIAYRTMMTYDGLCADTENAYMVFYSGQVTDGEIRVGTEDNPIASDAVGGITVELDGTVRTYTYTFPLGAEKSVESVVVKVAKIYGNRGANIVGVEVSNDGSAWTNVSFAKDITPVPYGVQGNANYGIEGAEEDLRDMFFDISATFSPVNASYVRVSLDTSNPAPDVCYIKNYNGTDYRYDRGFVLSFDEIQIFGGEPEAVTPSGNELVINSSNTATVSSGEAVYYTYTPVASGNYVIYSVVNKDTRVYLYDSADNQIASNDDGGIGSNFRLEHYLAAGVRYKFGIRFYYSSDSGEIDFKFGRVYTVSYDSNGGSGVPTSQSKDYGTDITLSSITPTRSGYSFAGWGINSSATTASYSAGDTYTNNADVTLYAVWRSTYPALSANNGYSPYISSGETKNYSFTPSESGKYVIYSTGSEDTRVYLYDSNGNQIASNDDGGEDYNFRLEYNLTAGANYVFAVKYYSSYNSGTLNFKFGKVYTVSYNANGGSGAPTSQSKDYGKAITLSDGIPTRAGYSFVGWASSASSSTVSYRAGDSYTSNQNLTLYAVWRVVNLVADREDYSLSSSDGIINYNSNSTLDGVCPPQNTSNDYRVLYSGQVTDGVYGSNAEGATVMLACPNRSHAYTFPLGGTRSVYSVVVRSATLKGNKCMNVTGIELSADGIRWTSVSFYKEYVSLEEEGRYDIEISFDTYNAKFVRVCFDSTNPNNRFDVSYNGSSAKGQYVAFQEIEVYGGYDTNGTDLPTGVYGDVNGDGVCDNLDAAYVLKYDANLITLDTDALTSADVNGDGVVNSLDAALILKRDANLISEFPIE